MSHLTTNPITLEPLINRVGGTGHGAVVTFLGTVRDHHEGRDVSRLEYSAYGPMAEAEIDRIVKEAEGRWSCQAAVTHRLGVLGIGDVAVAVAVAAPHRAEAYEGCRYIMDELKRRVPIWKREAYTDGTEEWVDPTQGALEVGDR
jgi:molybdopterin synthase catalytic subunit